MAFKKTNGNFQDSDSEQRSRMPENHIDDLLDKAGISRDSRLTLFGSNTEFVKQPEGTMFIYVNLNYKKNLILERWSQQLTEAFVKWDIIVNKK